jgi:hypothetical protein
MKHIADLGIKEESDAAYLYWDEDRDIKKFMVVSNKATPLHYKFEFENQTIQEGDLCAHGSAGIGITTEMKHEKVWITITRRNGDQGCLGYVWSTGSLYG